MRAKVMVANIIKLENLGMVLRWRHHIVIGLLLEEVKEEKKLIQNTVLQLCSGKLPTFNSPSC